ncbi:RimJ/RimL family protein N-acetyltransferase [Sphingomonas naasensis]|uniref:N-acetyltransferase n=1 Tax=Sphingomonas naasensis TaxID=1344951 RepID=A0A4S1WBC1_9SPHN|nr:GNAT family N-acetyltransferase [Sphingomonas naasensis]NIJ21325.1 RimJ/RimL family protein N-acetyltransferase [Sphingomonas naasensis]TGX38757.1 N-acetyltransferase [Sphingomonas naasensis]
MAPDRQPILEGALVRLRPMTADDRESLFAVASDRLIWEVHPAHDRWKRDVFDAFFDAGLASGGALVILDRATGAVIGSSRYDGYLADASEIEIGWTYIARACWGGTYNREIKRLMLDHIHRFVETATFMVGADNVRSRKAMEKIGGVLRPGVEQRVMAGVMMPHVVYEIRREGFRG